MVTMKGLRKKTRHTTHYSTWEEMANGRRGFRLCNHCCLMAIGARDLLSNDAPLTTWGYEGRGPDLTSAGLITLAIVDEIPIEEWRYSSMYGVTWSKYYFDVNGLSWNLAHGGIVSDVRTLSSLVIPYYRDFTKEFTSKWGDEWTMTSDEVMAWLKSKGYQPKEKHEVCG